LIKYFKNKNNESDDEKLNSSKVNVMKRNQDWVTWAVFLFTISIVLISLVSVIFPTLIASSDSIINELKELGVTLFEVNSFELGVWSVLLIGFNILIFTTTFLYFKKRLSKFIKNSFDFVFNFEVSKKIAFVTIALLLSIYVIVNFNELATEEQWEDYPGVIERLERWSPEQITSVEPHVRYFLLWSSMILFGNYRIIPFIASIFLLLLTYFFTVEISKKRFAGIISLIILLQSNVFLTYDSTVSYTNFWILFYLLSLFLVYKLWPISPLTYLLSIASKALTAMFLPMSLFFIYRSDIPRIRKIIIASASTAIILVGVLATTSGVQITSVSDVKEEFDWDEFWMGFSSFSYQLRFDGLVILFILPLIVGLFIATRNGIRHADSIMVLIGGILFSGPLLTGFTELTNQPYRFVPLVVFFAIGVGILLTKKSIKV